MKWDYRVCTRIIKKRGYQPYRVYAVHELFYTNDKITGHSTHSIELDNWPNFIEFKTMTLGMQDAFDKPIIDLDNFPNEYKSNEH